MSEIIAINSAELRLIDTMLIQVDHALMSIKDHYLSDSGELVIPVQYLDDEPIFEWGDMSLGKIVYKQLKALLKISNVIDYNVRGDSSNEEVNYYGFTIDDNVVALDADTVHLRAKVSSVMVTLETDDSNFDKVTYYNYMGGDIHFNSDFPKEYLPDFVYEIEDKAAKDERQSE